MLRPYLLHVLGLSGCSCGSVQRRHAPPPHPYLELLQRTHTRTLVPEYPQQLVLRSLYHQSIYRPEWMNH